MLLPGTLQRYLGPQLLSNTQCQAVSCLYLQSLQQLLSCGNVGHVDGGAEGVKHLHFLQDVFAAGGPNDEKLAALVIETDGLQHTEKH